jgi:uncharacterized protein
MLVRLFGKNFRSFKNEFELSMVAANLKRQEDRDRGIIRVEIDGFDEPLELLRVIGIYGPNASGKSTVIAAAEALNWLLESSQASGRNPLVRAYEPFLLDDETRQAKVLLGCDVVFGRSILRYELEYSGQAISRETLSLLNGNDDVVLIDRRSSDDIGGVLITESQANQLYVKEMQPDVGVLSKLAHHGPSKGEESARPYYVAIRDAVRCKDYSSSTRQSSSLIGRSDVYERFAEEGEFQLWIMQNLMRQADLGIVDSKVSREQIKISQDTIKMLQLQNARNVSPEEVQISFKHEGKSREFIEMARESSGTRKLFNVSGDFWALAHESVTLLVDEMCASFHPQLLDRLIRGVNDIPASQTQSQLIFTTHDTGLMEGYDGQPSALRRDQVYFTKKDSSGISDLYSLVEFKDDARAAHNLRKRYLSGLYGAIPVIGKVSL